MADQVDEVKQKTDIVALIGEYVQLKKAGRNYKALCPFHGEKTPSFMVSPELQIYKCFGCSESGDAFSFLEKYDGMDFGEALRFLADRAGVKLISVRPGDKGEKERLLEINSLASRFYHYILVGHPRGKIALSYLQKERGLNMATLKTFQIGFSPDTPGILRKFLVEKKKYQDKELEKAGLTVGDRSSIDRFRGRIIFPLLDHRGNTVGFSGRLLPGAKADLAKYINSPETPIYHKSRVLYGLNLAKIRIKEKKTAIVVEGELDMISSWQAGIQNTVAIKGSAFTEDQVRLLSRFGQKVILALDADFAGDTAARRGIAVAQTHGLEIKVAQLKDFKDPDEAVRKSPKEYKNALIKAIGVWDFLIDSVFSKHAGSTGEDKAKISREIVPVLASIPDKIVQAHYVKLAANRLGVSEDAVEGEVEGYINKGETEVPKVEPGVKSKSRGRRELLESRLLTLFFQKDIKGLLENEALSLIETPLALRIVDEIKTYFVKNKSFDLAKFSKDLPAELTEGFAEIILAEAGFEDETEERLNREMKLVVRELKYLATRDKLEVLAREIRELEAANKTQKLKVCQAKFSRLSQKLASLEENEDRGIIFEEA